LDAELKQEISAAVEKSLPKHLSETLQKRLQELEAKERELKTCKEHISTMQVEIDGGREKIEKLEALVKSEEILEKKATEIAARELKMDVFDLEVKLKASEASNEKVMGFVAALMRNTQFRKSTYLSNDHHFKNDGGRDSAPTGGTEDTEAE
jgi:hypothetical protein